MRDRQQVEEAEKAMSGRGDREKQGLGARCLKGVAATLLLSAATGLALSSLAGGDRLAAQAQEVSGAPISLDRAGNATGGSDAGHGASLLPAVAADNEPFDISGKRRPSPAHSAALVMDAKPEPFPLATAMTAEPTIGNGAPGTGAGTPGASSPSHATPATPFPTASTPGTVKPPQTADSAAPGAQVPTRLAETIERQLGRFATRPAEQQALAAFYAARGYKPAFTAGNQISPLGKVALDQFASAAVEGLNPADYAIPALPPKASDAQVAEQELRIAAATLAYARHVQSGRFDPKIIAKDVDPSPTVPDPAAVLALVSASPTPRAVFDSFAPQYSEYRLLKVELAKMISEGRGAGQVQVPAGPMLRPGDNDPRVPLLRARLGIGGAPEDHGYDSFLVGAVRDFQRLSGLKPDGVVGRGTIAALNGAGGDQMPDVIANMERWRWLPHPVAPIYVMANIPEYMVRIVVNEQTMHETRVVVGKPETQTPIMTENMQYAVFNPSWNVPPGIIRRDMLPKLQANPYALERQGIDVVRNGRIIDPGSVDWSRGTQGYSFRQEPGERNAMGQMKFMFPNKHAVYLHDTPSRSYFARQHRALSNGCVRVHEPLAFAEALFTVGLPNEGWSQQRISRLLGGNEKSLSLKQRFPVHLVYFTTYVDENGRLVTREDIYGTNAATKAILGLDGIGPVAAGSPGTLRQ